MSPRDVGTPTRVELMNWDSSMVFATPPVSPNPPGGSTRDATDLSSIPAIESRSCRVLLLADSSVNCRQMSHALTSFFSEYGILCSFDVFSNETLLLRIVMSVRYDVLFLSRDVVTNPLFRERLAASCNSQTPVVLYTKGRRNKSKSGNSPSSLLK